MCNTAKVFFISEHTGCSLLSFTFQTSNSCQKVRLKLWKNGLSRLWGTEQYAHIPAKGTNYYFQQRLQRCSALLYGNNFQTRKYNKIKRPITEKLHILLGYISTLFCFGLVIEWTVYILPVKVVTWLQAVKYDIDAIKERYNMMYKIWTMILSNFHSFLWTLHLCKELGFNIENFSQHSLVPQSKY